MKNRLVLWSLAFGLLVPLSLLAQVQTTVTGTVSGATSGYVEFRLQPASSSIQYYVVGTVVLAPQTKRCAIDGSGAVVAIGGVGACQVWANTSISPANTTYTVVFAPAGVVTNTVARHLISGATYNLTTPTFAPAVSIVPQYLSLITAPIAANLTPSADKVFNVGASNRYYGAGYFDNLFVNNLSAVTSSVTVGIFNNRYFCSPSGSFGAAVMAVAATLPATGGIIDCSNRIGAQTITSPIVITVPVRLILGAGTYSSSVTGGAAAIVVPDGSIVEGQGIGLTVLRATNNVSDGIQGFSNGVIQNLSLIGNTAVGSGSSAIDGCAACTDLWVLSVEVAFWGGHGVNTGGGGDRWRFINNFIHNNIDDGILFANGSVDGLVRDSTIQNNGSNAVDMGGHAGGKIINNIIEGNGSLHAGMIDATGALCTSILSGTADGCTIEGNTIRDNYEQQIVIRTDSNGHTNYFQVKNNHIYRTVRGTIGINVDLSLGATCGTTAFSQISGNIIHGFSSDGIQVGGGAAAAPCVVTALMVTNNTVVSNTGYGFRGESAIATATRLINNVFLNNTAGNIITAGSTRTLDFCNLTDTTTNLCSLTSGVMALNTIQPAVAGGIDISLLSTGSTKLNWTSSGAGRVPRSIFLDQFGNWIFFNDTSGLVQMSIDSAGIVDVVDRLTANKLGLDGYTAATLGAVETGTMRYCADCTVTSGADNTCTGGSDGAWAFGLAGVWRCFKGQN